MKGVSFQNGIEFKINIDGESWPQGGKLSGKIEAVSRNAQAASPAPGAAGKPEIFVMLAEARDHKVKAKAPDAFKVLQKFSSKNLQAGSSMSPIEWSFDLPLNARITDNPGSLYIIYGSSEKTETLGQLRLNIVPPQLLMDFIEIFKTHFRFALKNISSAKDGWVEVKLSPPPIQEWASLEQLNLYLLLTSATLEAKLQFQRQEVDATAGGVTSKSVKREVFSSLPLKTFVLEFNQRLNKEAATSAIDEAIVEYRKASWLKQDTSAGKSS